jgi:hypothetical protein
MHIRPGRCPRGWRARLSSWLAATTTLVPAIKDADDVSPLISHRISIVHLNGQVEVALVGVRVPRRSRTAGRSPSTLH